MPWLVTTGEGGINQQGLITATQICLQTAVVQAGRRGSEPHIWETGLTVFIQVFNFFMK